jgi:hypothetical protein
VKAPDRRSVQDDAGSPADRIRAKTLKLWDEQTGRLVSFREARLLHPVTQRSGSSASL